MGKGPFGAVREAWIRNVPLLPAGAQDGVLSSGALLAGSSGSVHGTASWDLPASSGTGYHRGVNYFAHGLRFLDRPWFLAGTAVPDWLCVADRRVRVRPRLVAPLLEEDGEAGSEIAAGILQHFHDDQWFHSTRGFAQTTAELTAQFRAVLGPADDWRPSFLGHVVTELLLDAVLIARRPEQLDEYYAALMKIDPERVQGVVNRASRNSTERLAPLIPLFVRERFLYDYLDAGRLLDRLNAVLRRVKLAPLPEAVIPVLDAGRELVAGRVDELLPPRHWGGGE